MSTTQANADPYKRHRTGHPGVTYRLRSDGRRSYYVYAGGRSTRVQGDEEQARAKRAELGNRVAHPFAQLAEEWLGSKRKLRRSTRERYQGSLNLWLLPRLGHLDVTQVTTDLIAGCIAELEDGGVSPASILNHLKPLSGPLKYSMRKGLIFRNPVALLTIDERPRAEQREMRILEPEEIEALLAASAKLAERKTARYDYTPILRTAVFSGLRLGELLGLQWQDVDRKAGTLHVRRQVTPGGEIIEPKTAKARRRVVLAPQLAQLLAQHLQTAQTGQANPESFLFASNAGRALSARNVVNRGFQTAVREATLNRLDKPKLRFHDLRHCYASMMIAHGLSSTDVAAQLGHANSGITERIYIHQFNSQGTYERLRRAAQQAMVSNQGSKRRL